MTQGKKLKHLEHIEDLLISEGESGLFLALEFLDQIGDALRGRPDPSLLINSKIDGSPGIVFGWLHGCFFVGKKSALTKNGQRYLSCDHINSDYKLDDELKKKLCAVYRALRPIVKSGAFQGDFLFRTADIKSEFRPGGVCFEFTPNIITYSCAKSTEQGNAIPSANIGVCVHTEYHGEAIEDLTASYAPDMRKFIPSHTVWLWDNKIPADSIREHIPHTDDQVTAFEDLVLRTRQMRHHIKPATYGFLSGEIGSWLKIFINGAIRRNETFDTVEAMIQGFGRFVWLRYEQKIQTYKTGKMQDQVRQLRARAIVCLHADRESISAYLQTYGLLAITKLALLERLQQNPTMQAYIAVDGNEQLTSGEGLVVANAKTNYAVKLVDRYTFSRMNFAYHD